MNRTVYGILLSIAAAGTTLADDGRSVFPGRAIYLPGLAPDYVEIATDLAHADFNADGLIDVAALGLYANIYNPTRTLKILWGQPDGLLAEDPDYPHYLLDHLFETTSHLAVGDLIPDGDGLPDIAVGGRKNDNMLMILRNLGPPDYRFAIDQTYLDFPAYTVTTGDFDGDGLVDIAHAGYNGQTAYVRYGRPGGWFADPFQIQASSIKDLASDDLDGDGRCDLVVCAANEVAVYYGSQEQSVGFDRSVHRPHPGLGGQLALADFNADGLLDIAHGAVIESELYTSLYVYYGNGNEADYFDNYRSVEAGVVTERVAAGDIDGDGRSDLAAIDWDAFPGAVLYSQGSVGFSDPVPFRTGSFTKSMDVVDLDRDGRAELIFGEHHWLLSILRSRPRGLIATGHDYPLLGNNSIALAAGDFDADGSVDLCVVNGDDNDIRILWGTGDGALELRAGDLPVGLSPKDVAVGHFDNDDELDLVVTNAGNNSLTIWHSVGAAEPSYPYREFLDPPLTGNPTRIVTGYFNDDARLDIAFLVGMDVVVIHGEPGGTLDKDNPETYAVGPGAVDIVSADLNYDGLPDLATISSGRSVSVLYAQADRTFGNLEQHDLSPALEPPYSTGIAIGAGDLNNDGLIDLFATSGDAVVQLYARKGGGFEEPARLDSPVDALGDLAVEDFDRDTIPDLVAAGYFAQHIWFGTADGELVHERFSSTYGNYPQFTMTVADFNNDGRPDIANIGNNPLGVGIMLNQSDAKIIGDLAVTNVSGPAGGMPGDAVTVSWTVQNQLDQPITGMWTDAVYLSIDEQWDINDRRLATLNHIGTLAPNDGAAAGEDEYEQSLDVTLPGVFPGPWYILVRTDATDAVLEDSGKVDNTMATPIDMTLPELTVCPAQNPCPVPGTFTDQRRALYWKLEAVAGEDLLVTLDVASEQGFYELYIRKDAVPSRSVFDARHPQLFDTAETPDQTARIPGTEAGTYYILAYANQLPPDGTVDFDLRAEYLPLGLTRVTPDRGGNTGRVTVTFTGSGFHPDVQVALRPYGGGEILPDVTYYYDFSAIAATFNLDGQPVTGCGLRLTNPGGDEVLLEEGFGIEEGIELDVAVDLRGPRRIRPGQPASYRLNIDNNGNVDIPYLFIDISLPAVHSNGVLATRIVIDEPPLTDPPSIDGIDWDLVDPMVELDGRLHYPLLWRDYPVTPPSSGGNVEFTITVFGDAPATPSRLSIDMIAFSDQLIRTSLEPEADAMRSWLLSDPPADDSVAQIQSDPDVWARLEGLLADPSIWRDYFVGTAMEGLMRNGERSFANRGSGSANRCSSWRKRLGHTFWNVLWDSPVNLLEVMRDFTAWTHRICDELAAWGMSAEDVLMCHVSADACAYYPNRVADCVEHVFQLIFPQDPNDKLSPSGWGENGFVPPEYAIPYTIRFENLPAATAAALKVNVTDRLSGDLDWATLALDEIGFAGIAIEVPDGLSHYDGQVEIAGWTWDEVEGCWVQYDDAGDPLVPLVVDIEADIDADTGIITWSLRCADVNTGYFPEDPFAGFLPPNQEDIFYPDPADPDDPPRLIHPGEGYLTYSVRPMPDLPTGTAITNIAEIVFDWNAPMETPEVLNTIDAAAPTSNVEALPAEVNHASFDVCWSGEDDAGGCGIESYSVHFSDNDGPYTTWLTTGDECNTFTGAAVGHTYSFYSVARDHVGHVELPPTDPEDDTVIIPDATTTVRFGDFDGNGAVDLVDYDAFQTCVTGAGGGAAGCEAKDFDLDDDVDLIDFAAFQIGFRRPE